MTTARWPHWVYCNLSSVLPQTDWQSGRGTAGNSMQQGFLNPYNVKKLSHPHILNGRTNVLTLKGFSDWQPACTQHMRSAVNACRMRGRWVEISCRATESFHIGFLCLICCMIQMKQNRKSHLREGLQKTEGLQEGPSVGERRWGWWEACPHAVVSSHAVLPILFRVALVICPSNILPKWPQSFPYGFFLAFLPPCVLMLGKVTGSMHLPW